MAALFFTNKSRLHGFFIELFFSMMLILALCSRAEKGTYLVCQPIILLVDGAVWNNRQKRFFCIVLASWKRRHEYT